MATDEKPLTRAELVAAVAEIKANQERAVDSFATGLTEVRQELHAHLEGIDRRLERIGDSVRTIDLRISAMSQRAGALDRYKLKCRLDQPRQ